jgi:hypothetical protein
MIACSQAIIVFTRPFILCNKSSSNIHYTLSKDSTIRNLAPNQFITLDTNQKCIIRQQGYDYTVPIKELLSTAARENPRQHFDDLYRYNPVCIFRHGLLYGYAFCLDWQLKS